MTHIFLIHGMGRSPISMWLLGRRLRRLGFRTHLFGYLVTSQKLDTIAERFTRRVRSVLAADAAANGSEAPDYAVVTHSLGGIITRLASPRLPEGWRGFVMMAPPNRPPVAARFLERNALFRLLTRDAGSRLTDPGFYERLPVPEVPMLVIAGTRGPRAAWLPFSGAVNDSVVRLEETRLEGVRTVTVPAVHTFLMNRGDVFATIRDFLSEQRSDSMRPAAGPSEES